MIDDDLLEYSYRDLNSVGGNIDEPDLVVCLLHKDTLILLDGHNRYGTAKLGSELDTELGINSLIEYIVSRDLLITFKEVKEYCIANFPALSVIDMKEGIERIYRYTPIC